MDGGARRDCGGDQSLLHAVQLVQLALQRGHARRALGHENDDFRDQYARAREEQADLLVRESLEIADRGKDEENENPSRVRRDQLRIDTRKWWAARLAPKKYGDYVGQEKASTTSNFQPAILIRVGGGPAVKADEVRALPIPE